MEEKGKKTIVAGIDFFVSIIIVIIGFILIFYANDWMSITSQIPYTAINSIPYLLINKVPWIILLVGVATFLYGIKRLFDNLTKIF